MIIVCPLSAVQLLVEQHKVGHVVSLLGPEIQHPSIARIDARRHLRLTFHDIIADAEGFVTPTPRDTERLIRFFEEWSKAEPMLIHCWAGISRSTAAAYTAMCLLKPETDEERLALRLRELSPSASPNRLIVAHADAVLGRGGRMVAAVDAIGRGSDAHEGTPFSFMP
jgi:predicted protein tyrosine phosphatase